VQIQSSPDALGLTHHVPSGSIAVGAPILVDAGDRAVAVFDVELPDAGAVAASDGLGFAQLGRRDWVTPYQVRPL
jgi:hypothetical protein